MKIFAVLKFGRKNSVVRFWVRKGNLIKILDFNDATGEVICFYCFRALSLK